MKKFVPERKYRNKRITISCVQEIRPVPIFCNQWGVKHLVPENLGRRQYVRDLANLFVVGIIFYMKVKRDISEKSFVIPKITYLKGIWDPLHLLDMEVLPQRSVDWIWNGSSVQNWKIIIPQDQKKQTLICSTFSGLLRPVWYSCHGRNDKGMVMI